MSLKLIMFFIKTGKIEKGTKPCAVCGYLDAYQRRAPQVSVSDGKVVFGEAHDLCVFCVSLSNLETASRQRLGKLIYLPEISQRAVNEIVRAVIMIRGHKDKDSEGFKPYLQAAQSVYDGLRARAALMEKICGKDSAEPEVFANAVSEMTGGFANPKAQELMASLRFLPSPEKYSVMAPEIQSAMFGKVADPSAWENFLEEYRALTSEATVA